MATILTYDRRCGTDDIAECAAQIGDSLHTAVWIDALNPYRVHVASDPDTVRHWLVSEGFALDEITVDPA